jgi:hypothetical protein
MAGRGAPQPEAAGPPGPPAGHSGGGIPAGHAAGSADRTRHPSLPYSHPRHGGGQLAGG